MPAPHVIIPRLEGLNGLLMAVADQDTEFASLWIKMAIELLKSYTNRGFTDWEFALQNDVDESANNILNGAGTVYGVLIRTNAAAVDRISITNDTSNTYDDTAALDAGDLLVLYANSSGSEATNRWTGFLCPGGVAFGTGITIGADGIGGTNPATDDIDVFLLYRDRS